MGAVMSAGCPSNCFVNCEESRFSVELSSGKFPGFLAFCGGADDFYLQVDQNKLKQKVFVPCQAF